MGTQLLPSQLDRNRDQIRISIPEIVQRPGISRNLCELLMSLETWASPAVSDYLQAREADRKSFTCEVAGRIEL